MAGEFPPPPPGFGPENGLISSSSSRPSLAHPSHIFGLSSPPARAEGQGQEVVCELRRVLCWPRAPTNAASNMWLFRLCGQAAVRRLVLDRLGKAPHTGAGLVMARSAAKMQANAGAKKVAGRGKQAKRKSPSPPPVSEQGATGSAAAVARLRRPGESTGATQMRKWSASSQRDWCQITPSRPSIVSSTSMANVSGHTSRTTSARIAARSAT